MVQQLQHLVKNFKEQVSTIVSDDSVTINIESNKAILSMDDSQLQVHIPLQSSSPNLFEGHNVLQHQRGQNRRKKRPKMIIVDKSQRRPQSRLVGVEHALFMKALKGTII
jgi:hypothetical protein